MASNHSVRHHFHSHNYWLFQIAGWSGLTIIFYLSLTLWYNPGQWPHAIHTIVQSALGLVISHPLRSVASRNWYAPIWRRALFNALGIVIASLIWTVGRLATFEWLTGEHVAPQDYGGWAFASLIVYASWVVCYHAFKYYHQWLEQRDLALEAKARVQAETMRRLEAENLYRETQMRMLKYQLNPHFLFNALNSVALLVRKDQRNDAIEAISRIADFMRISLERDDELEHNLSEEVDTLRLYIDIEKIRFCERLDVKFNISHTAGRARVPYLLLQPLFENAVKYGVGKSLSTTTVQLDAWIEHNRLELRVRDTGPGDVSLEQSGQSNLGIGLRNVEQRLRSAFADDFRFELVSNAPRGFCVEISIPAQFDRLGVDGTEEDLASAAE